jgi:Leucine-rich repeat (LRR) protein
MYRILLFGFFFFLAVNLLSARQPLDSAALVNAKLYMSVGEALNEPGQVHKLCLGGHELKVLPEGIDALTNLQEINVSQNYLELIPDSFCSLPFLEEIKLGGNELKRLPDNFGKLLSLKRLDLSNNSKMDWKMELSKISKLINLVTLDLSYNDIDYLPDSFVELKNLRELNLAGNKFTEEEKNRIRQMLPGALISFD